MNSFSYLSKVTSGSSGLSVPGLLSVPNLDATLRMHREYQSRVREDLFIDSFDPDTPAPCSVEWADSHEEMSHDLLVAQAISVEIGKALDLLGIEWRASALQAGPADDSQSSAKKSQPGSPDLDEQTEQLIAQAIALTRFFADLGDDWVVDEHHIYAERCLDEEEGIFDTTIDEWELSCPDLPVIEGLRDWGDISLDMEEEGYLFDGPALVEDCSHVLTGLVNLVLLKTAT